MQMKCMIATLLLLLSVAVHTHAQQPTQRGMSAIDIAESLASPTQAQRERGLTELKLMNVETAQALGGEIMRLDVREAQTCLTALASADCDNAAITACIMLDSNVFEIRAGALDTLITMHPSHVGEHCDKLLRRRTGILRKLVTEEDYLKLLAEGVKTGEKGKLQQPVEQALALTVLMDRHLGAAGMPLIVSGFAALMLGDDGELKPSAVQRYLDERRRRGATVWCETIWVADPSVQFNYSPTAPRKEREDAINRLHAKLNDMQKKEVTLAGETYTGMRYGDYLIELYGSDVSETKAAAYMRTQWLRGDEVIVAGEGYAEAVDTLNAMNNRELSRMRRDLYRWWYDHRKATEIK